MVTAFERRSDVGSAAPRAIDNVADVWNAPKSGTTNSEYYHDFQVRRPTISRLADGQKV